MRTAGRRQALFAVIHVSGRYVRRRAAAITVAVEAVVDALQIDMLSRLVRGQVSFDAGVSAEAVAAFLALLPDQVADDAGDNGDADDDQNRYYRDRAPAVA